ncbi:MAG: hypothetical protein ABSH34_24390 [Verrucomicrobiota bacterium]|jgi:hypothetical protein
MITTSSPTRRWLFRGIVAIALAVSVALALGVVLIAIPIARRLIVVGLAEWMLGGRLESLAVDLDIQPNLRWVFTLLIVLPVGFGLARMVVARNFSAAARGLALAAATLLLLAVAVWWRTGHFNFDAKGRPVVYLSFRRDGVRKSYSPGIDHVTGCAKFEATVDQVLWLSDLVRQPVREVDPAVETNWFDPNSGEPNLWYVEAGPNRWQFFNRPMFHPRLAIEASPTTPALMRRWQGERDRQAAAAEVLRQEREAAAREAAEEQRREDRAAAEKHALEERERAEHLRLAEFSVKAEAEARARAQAEQRTRDEELRRKQNEAREQAATAAEAARRAQEHRRQINQRRLSEAIAAPSSLNLWSGASFLARVSPELDPHHPATMTFEDGNAGRRFRFHNRLVQVGDSEKGIEFAATAFWTIDLLLSGNPQASAEKGFKKGHDVHFVATVERLQTVAFTNRNLVILRLSGIEPIAAPVVPVFEVAAAQVRVVSMPFGAPPPPPVVRLSPSPAYGYSVPPSPAYAHSISIPSTPVYRYSAPPPTVLWQPYRYGGAATPRAPAYAPPSRGARCHY